MWTSEEYSKKLKCDATQPLTLDYSKVQLVGTDFFHHVLIKSAISEHVQSADSAAPFLASYWSTTSAMSRRYIQLSLMINVEVEIEVKV